MARWPLAARRLPLTSFTLVELLVVVAILALLAALLMPALKGARTMGQIATCASNLRQIGAAAHLYASDYGGFVMAPYGWNFWKTPSPTGSNPRTSLSSLSDNGYLGPPANGNGSKVFLCPWLQRNRKLWPKNAGTTSGGQVNYSTSYLLGEVAGDGNWTTTPANKPPVRSNYRRTNSLGPARLSDINGLARCFLAGDAQTSITLAYQFAGDYDTACNVTWGGSANRLIGNIQIWDNTYIGLDLTWKLGIVTHGGPNLLFWDGHVERYIYPVGATSAYPANPNGPGGLSTAFPWNRTTYNGLPPDGGDNPW